MVTTSHPFTDLVSGRAVVLHVSADPTASGVEHPDCDQLADVSPGLDAFYCSKCRWSGRISGAWFVDLVTAAAEPPNGFWNGEATPVRKVVVEVAPSPFPTWWCASLAGTERCAVEVTYDGRVFFLDDEDGSGWAKVTTGRGSPRVTHRSLPDDCVLVASR